MRDLFPGYHRPTLEEFERYWSEGVFVLDANVLLDVYRFSGPSRNQLFEVLERVKDQLWVPHQAAYEFQRGRIGVIDEQRKQYDRVINEIKKSKRSILSGVRRQSVMDHAQLAQKLDEQLQPVLEYLDQLRASHSDPILEGDWIGRDSVRDALATLLEGKIGPPLSDKDIEKEGRRRYAARIPPGYSDEKKPEPQRYGDLVMWFEMIARARDAKLPIVFITGDQKEDWWWLTMEGRAISARPELVAEMQAEAQTPFYMYALERFIGEASQRFDIEVTEEALQEARDIGDQRVSTDLKERCRDLAEEITRFLSDRNATDPYRNPHWTDLHEGESPSDAFTRQSREGMDHSRTTMDLYHERFGLLALALCDEALAQGWIGESERHWFEHPTNPLGIRHVAQTLGTIGYRRDI